MFTVIGGGIALLLTSLTFLGVNFTIGEGSSAFMSWGWRIPFLFSGVLIAIALYVRLNIRETPVFAQQKPEQSKARNWRQHHSPWCCVCNGVRSCWPPVVCWVVSAWFIWPAPT